MKKINKLEKRIHKLEQKVEQMERDVERNTSASDMVLPIGYNEPDTDINESTKQELIDVLEDIRNE